MLVCKTIQGLLRLARCGTQGHSCHPSGYSTSLPLISDFRRRLPVEADSACTAIPLFKRLLLLLHTQLGSFHPAAPSSTVLMIRLVSYQHRADIRLRPNTILLHFFFLPLTNSLRL